MKDDFSWFVENYDALYAEYGHKFLVIKHRTVLGAYDTMRQALDNTHEKRGTFIVQECNGNISAFTIYLPSLYIA